MAAAIVLMCKKQDEGLCKICGLLEISPNFNQNLMWSSFSNTARLLISTTTSLSSSQGWRLEQESGFYFNMKHFEDQVLADEWNKMERYLSGFTKVEDKRYSMKIFFEIRRQKYLEALNRNDRAKAVYVLIKDLKDFATFSEELFKEITQLLTLENFRKLVGF